MSNERADEFPSWRGRLEDPDGVPGHGLDDREAAWGRLMERFRSASRRRRGFVGGCRVSGIGAGPPGPFFPGPARRVVVGRSLVWKPVLRPEEVSRGAARIAAALRTAAISRIAVPPPAAAIPGAASTGRATISQSTLSALAQAPSSWRRMPSGSSPVCILMTF